MIEWDMLGTESIIVYASNDELVSFIYHHFGPGFQYNAHVQRFDGDV